MSHELVSFVKGSLGQNQHHTKLESFQLICIFTIMSRGPNRAGMDPKKVSGELFSLTYGALVSQILKDYENVDDVNRQLEKMGYNIGIRLVEDFLCRTNGGKCTDFRETSEKIQVRVRDGQG